MCIISDYIAVNGVTECAPARAQGANMHDVHRIELSKTRKAWSIANQTPLGVGAFHRDGAA